VAFEAELVLEGPDDRFYPLAQPVREVPGLLFVLAAGRIRARPRFGPDRNSSNSFPEGL